MNWAAQCGVVIPCRNEARTIQALVEEVRQRLPTVVVVDDGSTDRTAALLEGSGAVLLRHGRSRGKGAALTTGMNWLWERQFQWALLMDGDGQHAPADIPALLDRAVSSGAAMVVGNRMNAPSAMPWLRRLANRWMSQRLAHLTGQLIPDSQCGFRLLQLPLWAALRLETHHFEIESELLVAFIGAGHKTQFVPIRSVYGRERSKISPVADTWRWIRWWRQAMQAQKAVGQVGRRGIQAFAGDQASPY